MEEIFYELINEAKDGKVIMDGEEWPIAFNTLIEEDNTRVFNNDNLSMLHIKNKSEFFVLLNEYVNKELEVGRKTMKFYGENKDRDTIKCIMSYLFVNATTEDFLNPSNFIRRRIKFLEDNTMSFFRSGTVLELGPVFKGSKLFVQDMEQSVMMETPRKFCISFKRDGYEYKLPEVSYGIVMENGKNVCYIYSLLDKQDREITDKGEEKYYKEIKRLLYKVNSGVIDESEEENIKDVSPSSVISLIVFATILRKYNISDIRAVPYLPLRYLSRDITSRYGSPLKRTERDLRNATIQYNVTNKFIRTFNRVSYHLDGFDVVASPYEFDEYLHVVNSSKNQVIDNELLDDVSSSISL